MLEEEELEQTQLRQESPETDREGMAVEENSSLSDYHKSKLFLGFLKILPMLMAAMYLANTVLSYFYIESREISYFSSLGIIPWAFIMFASYRLHFCEYHRMFLWYILVNNLICWTDERFTLSIDNWNYFILHISIAGLFLFLVLYFHQKCRKHKN
jgi:hypothetical protein